MTLSPHENQLKVNNPYAKGMPMFKHSFEIPNVGQGVEISNWLAEYEINFSIYPVTDIVNIRDMRGLGVHRQSKDVLLVAFDSDDELASMFVLRWATDAVNKS